MIDFENQMKDHLLHQLLRFEFNNDEEIERI